jgi:hypothetical protein
MATPGAIDALKAERISIEALLHRHVTGDWGDLVLEDAQENDLAVSEGWRILSAYDLPRTGGRVWIITESDRSATTFLLPEEY